MQTLKMKNWMSGRLKASLLVLLFLLIGFGSSAQKVSMMVYRSQLIIFERAVSDIDSVKF